MRIMNRYQNSILEFQKKYNLRNRKVVVNTEKSQVDQHSSSQMKQDPPRKEAQKKDEYKEDDPLNKIQEEKKESGPKDVDKSKSLFSLENEMSKIKILVPFDELLRNVEYIIQIMRMFKYEHVSFDILNLQDDYPTVLFGPRVEEKDFEGDGDVPPFYISLNLHEMTLHNTMLDSGESHNLMPKAIMESLGLDITRPYRDLYSFDSNNVKCIGVVKDLVISLTQIHAKSLIMDVIVLDNPFKLGMLLSRSLSTKLKGTLQMDMSYATIPIFGEQRRLYRESRLNYMVSSKDKPENHPIYFVDT